MTSWPFLTALVLFPLFYAVAIWDARRLLRVWAEREGLRLMHVESRLISQGPFSHQMSVRQLVFFVRALKSGEEKTGYVCCGHFLWGAASGKVEARWKEEPIQAAETTRGKLP